MHPFGIAPGWFPKPEASSEESTAFLGVVSVSNDAGAVLAPGRESEPEALPESEDVGAGPV